MSAKPQAKVFILDIPAPMTRKRADLSRQARGLYMTMRGLANGRTGELAIRGNPLDWKYICRRAEIKRDTWQRCRKELLAVGLLTVERDRVLIYRNGRKRVVLGRAHYFVHRQAKPPKRTKTAKNSSILLMPDFSTVEESGTQISSKTPYCSDAASDSHSRELEIEKSTHKSSKAPVPDDDFSRVTSSDSKANPFLTKEDAKIIRGVRRNLREAHHAMVEELRLDTIEDGWFLTAMDYIEARGTAKIGSPIPYFTKAFVNFFAGVLTNEENDIEMLKCINGEKERKAKRREDFMTRFSYPVTEESEARRREFVGRVRPERQHER